MATKAEKKFSDALGLEAAAETGEVSHLPPIRKTSFNDNATKEKRRESIIKPTRKISHSATPQNTDTLAARKRSTSSIKSTASSLRGYRGKLQSVINLRNMPNNNGNGDLREVVLCPNIDFTKLDTKEKTQDAIEEHIQSEIKLLYKSLDINGNACLTPEEVKWAFHFFRKTKVTMEDAVLICEELSGQKGVPSVTQEEFAKAMHETMTNNIGEAEVRLIFDVMDFNDQGVVGPTGIIHLFQKFGVLMDEKDAFDCIDEICTSGSSKNKYGVFDFEQFRCYINRFDTTYGMLKNHYWTLLSKEL